jgi:hypothetical protein
MRNTSRSSCLEHKDHTGPSFQPNDPRADKGIPCSMSQTHEWILYILSIRLLGLLVIYGRQGFSVATAIAFRSSAFAASCRLGDTKANPFLGDFRIGSRVQDRLEQRSAMTGDPSWWRLETLNIDADVVVCLAERSLGEVRVNRAGGRSQRWRRSRGL